MRRGGQTDLLNVHSDGTLKHTQKTSNWEKFTTNCVLCCKDCKQFW